MLPKVITICSLLFLNVFFLLNLNCTAAQQAKEDSNSANTSQIDIDTLYHSDVIGVSKKGLIRGKEAMNKFLLDFHKSQGALEKATSHFKIAVQDILEYEIGSFETEKNGQFATMTIWTKEHGSDQKILEVVYEKSKHEVTREAIDSAREKWVKLCNLHNTKNLVEALYTEDAIYYNRGRILRGHVELTQEYSYMQQSSYELQLHPKHVEIVSDDMAFEIGKCSGSYNLPYMLVWKKELDGNWKIYLDSNY